ncbi:alpha/beta hydrolase [Polaromonas sp. SM01]|uniref:alpha/beta fold hydrolase n=1 Tax=Polaromonas sp. SM01 TaxID=3085630 RepID=UPI002981D875|nr:alpha/beta hydrolase [Polaromonas sp. SM01]MDW5442805.1 alpha/beta hydrolase [Polaromonas sp. SM01]
MYKEKRPSRSEFVPIRGINYHVRHWGEAQSSLPPLVLVHGWMDVAASYQFVVDALLDAFIQGRSIIAPDWRGYGQTGSGGARLPAGPPQGQTAPSGGSALHEVNSVGAPDNFWFPDYLADLDFLLDHYAPGQQIDLVGHSMGGNVAMLYSGVRPERIRKLVNLEGFGMQEVQPSLAPTRYAKWMDELKTLHKGELALKPYADADGVARRLMRTNTRLSQDKADWLARHWARPDAQGQWHIQGDPAHKIINANIYRLDEVLEIYQRISAPTLAVEASDDSLGKWWQGKYTLAQYHERLQSVPQVSIAVIQDAGHMLHHDQPAQLARLLEGFLG